MTEVAVSSVTNETKVAGPLTSSPTTRTGVLEKTSMENTSGHIINNGTIENGESKESLEMKDPKKDPLGWLKQQSSAAVHKVNFHILEWAINNALGDEAKSVSIPRKMNLDFVTRTQFVNFLKDGQILARLANKFEPGSVETVYEGEAGKEIENQTLNIQGFIKFAKEKASIPEDQVFSVEDLQEKGKTGYEAVINTLFHLGFRAHDQFSQPAIDLEKMIEEVKKVVDPNFFKKFVNIFHAGFSVLSTKLARSQSTEIVKDAKISGTNGAAENEDNVESEVKKVEVIPNSTEIVASQ